MSDKKASLEDTNATQPRPTRKKPALPNIHPDDAKDKVFTAILKALLKKGNKPSSPKELANDIVKHKYATLGGATPFATVSSRISQHFKRAAEHNPPRAPLLAKHVDQRHSRKINYSLITPGDNSANNIKSSPESSSSSTALPSLPQKSKSSTTSHQQGQHPLAQHHGKVSSPSLSAEGYLEEKSSDSSNTLSDEEHPQTEDNKPPGGQQHFLRSSSHTGSKSSSLSNRRSSSSLRRRRRPRTRGASPDLDTHHQSDSDQESPEPKRLRRESSIIGYPSFSNHHHHKHHHHHHDSTNNIENTPPTKLDSDEDDSEAEYSDYYEDMMKGDETMAHIEISRRRSSVFRRPSSTVNSGSTTTTITPNDSTDSTKLVGRKLSLPLNGLLGDNEFWTPYTFEQDLNNDNIYVAEHTTSHQPHPQISHQPQVSLNIVPPESISETELELYFGGPTLSTNVSGNNNNNNSSSNSNNGWLEPNSSNASARTGRKSFCSVSNGKEASLLHRALMANPARGKVFPTGTQIDENDEDEDDNNEAEPIMRRKSWPLTGSELLNQPDEPINFDVDNKDLDKATSEEPQQRIVKSASPQKQHQITKPAEDDAEIERAEKDNGKTAVRDMATQGKEEIVDTKSETKDVNSHTSDSHTSDSISKSYFKNGHHFTISKKLFGNLQCYELESPDDIPDTKVLRFIASNDGASEHVALRTRHADSTKQEQRRNSQHFYLVEGCVNATQLRKAARPVLGKGSFDAAAEVEAGRLVVTLTKGSMECRGAWVTLARARKLVDDFEIESSPGLAKLLSDDPMDEQDDSERRTSISESNDAASPTSITSGDDTTSKIDSVSASMSHDEANDEEFVRFEEDEKASTNSASQDATGKTGAKPTPIITTPAPTAPTSTAQPSPNTNTNPSPSTNTSNFNLSTLQQLAAAIPGLSNGTPTVDLARSFASYMQAVAKATSGSSTSSMPSSPSPPFDIRSALARFPGLDALFKKDSSLASLQPTASQSVPTSPTGGLPLGTTDTNKIFPTTPTNPPIYIALIDNVTVCVATLSVPGGDNDDKTYNVMRRMDTGFVNGTTLLTAGGIDTERERSMILSFEMERIRIPNKNSELYGTWIPLRRAQELAVTCSIQNRLGPFLSDRLESYFSSTIPISRGPSGVRSGKPIPGLRRSSSGSDHGNGNSLLMMSAAAAATDPTHRKSATSTQLQQLLLSHPYKTLKLGGANNSSHGMLKAPLLGNFDRMKDLRQQRSISVINSRRPHSKSDDDMLDSPGAAKHSKRQPRDTDIDILNDNDSDADTESDTDVKEVRQQMKRMRDAAIDAMETGQSMDLEELLSRASGPIVQSARPGLVRTPSLPAHSTTGGSATPIKRRRLFDIDEEGNPPPAFRKPANFLPHGRRRPPTVGNHGPNGTWVGGNSGKLTTSLIKKSASWNGSLPLPRNNVVLPGNKKAANGGSKRKKAAQRKNSNDNDSNNHVVEHQEKNKASVVKSIGSPALAVTSTAPVTSSPLSSNVDTAIATSTTTDMKDSNTPGKDKTSPLVSNLTAKAATPSTLDEDEDEEIDIGGSDDDDDVR